MQIIEAMRGVGSKTMNAEEYFNKIYAQTSRDILKCIVIRTSNAHQVDDIFQNVYQNFFVRLQRKGCADIENPYGFLIKLTQKELAKHYKRKSVSKEVTLEQAEELAEDIPFAELTQQKEWLDRIGEIVQGQPLLSYQCFVLYYHYDMAVATIGTTLGISADSVKMRLMRTRNAVRSALKGEER